MLNVVDKQKIVKIKKAYQLLIPSRFPPIQIYERLVANNHEQIAAIESITNPRLQSKTHLIQSSEVTDENSPRLQNWNHAPFAYSNPEGSRYFSPFIPCLELSEDRQTALAVSVMKREAFLKQTNEEHVKLDMRVLTRTVTGNFLDCRDLSHNLSQEQRWNLGSKIIEREVDGILFHSPERPCGNRIAILNGETLSRAIQADHYRYIWNGNRIIELYSFTKGDVIDPASLIGTKNVLAA
jgi:hypothetical protein